MRKQILLWMSEWDLPGNGNALVNHLSFKWDKCAINYLRLNTILSGQSAGLLWYGRKYAYAALLLFN